MGTFHRVHWAPSIFPLAIQQWQDYLNGGPPPARESLVVMATIDALRTVAGLTEEDPDEVEPSPGEPEVPAQRGSSPPSG